MSRLVGNPDARWGDQVLELVKMHPELEAVQIGDWYGLHNEDALDLRSPISRSSLVHVFSPPKLLLIDLRSARERKGWNVLMGKTLMVFPQIPNQCRHMFS